MVVASMTQFYVYTYRGLLTSVQQFSVILRRFVANSTPHLISLAQPRHKSLYPLLSHFFSFKQIIILHALTLHIQTHILMARTTQCDISHLLLHDGSESADVNVCNNVSMWGRVQGDLIITLLAPPPVTRLHRDTSPRAPVAPDISYSEHRYRGGGSSLVTELLQSRDYCRLRIRIPQFRHRNCDEKNIQRRSILQPLHQCNEGFGCQRSLNSPSVKFIAKMGKYHDIADSLHSIKSEEAQLESINFQRVAIWVLADAQPWVCPSHPAQSTAAQHLAATSATSCRVPGSRGSDCRIMPLYPAWTCPATGSFQNCLSNQILVVAVRHQQSGCSKNCH